MGGGGECGFGLERFTKPKIVKVFNLTIYVNKRSIYIFVYGITMQIKTMLEQTLNHRKSD